ncbi:hypothetical protein RF11_11304 [Thelohanellus kitauei]|uniref:Uncharacterized protein n=1 Tax=Thelohanellus kitauei TaxID=669202 RepID=A0A0C2MA68_THEKT|nr:hypothetical protein RF11_11304 [Thelohanellus kitauei]
MNSNRVESQIKDNTGTKSLLANHYRTGSIPRGYLKNNFIIEVFKPAAVHFLTDFTSTSNATVSTYDMVVLRVGTLLQAVWIVQDSHLLNTHPYPQHTRATIPNRHSFAEKQYILS